VAFVGAEKFSEFYIYIYTDVGHAVISQSHCCRHFARTKFPKTQQGDNGAQTDIFRIWHERHGPVSKLVPTTLLFVGAVVEISSLRL